MFWLLSDEDEGEIEADVLSVFVEEFPHLGSDDHENIGDVWIEDVDFMDVLLFFSVIGTNGGEILVFLLVGDIVLVDV